MNNEVCEINKEIKKLKEKKSKIVKEEHKRKTASLLSDRFQDYFINFMNENDPSEYEISTDYIMSDMSDFFESVYTQFYNNSDYLFLENIVDESIRYLKEKNQAMKSLLNGLEAFQDKELENGEFDIKKIT